MHMLSLSHSVVKTDSISLFKQQVNQTKGNTYAKYFLHRDDLLVVGCAGVL